MKNDDAVHKYHEQVRVEQQVVALHRYDALTNVDKRLVSLNVCHALHQNVLFIVNQTCPTQH